MKLTLLVFLFISHLSAWGAPNGKQCLEVVETSDTSVYGLKLKSDYSPLLQEAWKIEFTQEAESFRLDPANGVKKWEIFHKLGFSGTKTPDYFEFLKKYLLELKAQNRKVDDSLLPALVMVKGEVGQVTEHRLIVPGIDSWPLDPGFRFLTSEEVFNIPFRSVLEGLKKNRFPLMDAIHDVSHFMSYLQNPAYTKALITAARKIPVMDKYPVHFSRRLLFALEFLTLADVSQVEKIKDLLLFPKSHGGPEYRPVSDYKAYFDRLSTKALLQHAQKLVSEYDSMLMDFGGGVYRSFEKNEMIKDQFLNSQDLSLSLIQILAEFRNDRSELQRNLMSPLLSATLKQLLEIRKLSRQELQALTKRNQYIQQYFANSKLDDLIRLHVARMEYGLWESSHRISPEKWVEETVVIEMEKNSEVARFIQELYGPRSPLSLVLEN